MWGRRVGGYCGTPGLHPRPLPAKAPLITRGTLVPTQPVQPTSFLSTHHPQNLLPTVFLGECPPSQPQGGLQGRDDGTGVAPVSPLVLGKPWDSRLQVRRAPRKDAIGVQESQAPRETRSPRASRPGYRAACRLLVAPGRGEQRAQGGRPGGSGSSPGQSAAHQVWFSGGPTLCATVSTGARSTHSKAGKLGWRRADTAGEAAGRWPGLAAGGRRSAGRTAGRKPPRAQSPRAG